MDPLQFATEYMNLLTWSCGLGIFSGAILGSIFLFLKRKAK